MKASSRELMQLSVQFEVMAHTTSRISEILGKNFDLNMYVATWWPLKMSADEAAAEMSGAAEALFKMACMKNYEEMHNEDDIE